MPFTTKVKVVIAFAFRLLLIPPSAARLPALHASIYSANPAAFTVKVQIMSLLACQVSVISATIPCAKPFFSVFARGNLGRTRASILPMQRPTMYRGESSTSSYVRRRRDRANSIDGLHLRPERGVNFTKAEHVPDLPHERLHRPSLVNSKHSSMSITYSREFEVTYQDFGGLSGDINQTTTRVTVEASGRGSSAGFSWSGSKWSRRRSSQRSKSGSA